MYHSSELKNQTDTRRMQMLPSLRSHQEYVKFANRHIQKVQIPKAHDDVPLKLKLLDLTSLSLLSTPPEILFQSDAPQVDPRIRQT